MQGAATPHSIHDVVETWGQPCPPTPQGAIVMREAITSSPGVLEPQSHFIPVLSITCAGNKTTANISTVLKLNYTSTYPAASAFLATIHSRIINNHDGQPLVFACSKIFSYPFIVLSCEKWECC